MKNDIILWVSSILIAFLIGYIKNVTDKDYPVTGTFGIEGKKVSYKLDRVSFDKTSYKNIIISDVKGVSGILIRLEDHEQKETAFKEIDRGLECEIPKLKPGEKTYYKVILNYADKQFVIPKEEFVALTFWGNIPSPVNILHFTLLYGVLLISIRSLLELFNKNKKLKKYAIVACIFFITLSTIINPLRNSYKLGAINNYVPQVTDLLQPALLLMLLIWLLGSILVFNRKYVEITTIFVVVVTVVLFFFI